MKKIPVLIITAVTIFGLLSFGAASSVAAAAGTESFDSKVTSEEQALLEAEKLIYVKADYESAFTILQNWLDTDYAPLQALIGECYWYGYGTEVDDALAYDYFSRAAEQGNLIGKYGVAACLHDGLGVTQDRQKGEELFFDVCSLSLKAAEETENPVEKGILYFQASYPTLFINLPGTYTKEAHKEAFEAMEKSANCGYLYAELWAGLMYKNIPLNNLTGQRVLYLPERDDAKGEAYLISANKHGNTTAKDFINVFMP